MGGGNPEDVRGSDLSRVELGVAQPWWRSPREEDWSQFSLCREVGQ